MMNGFQDMMNMMDGMTGGWGGFGLAGALINLLLLVALLAALAWVVAKILSTGGRGSGRLDTAEEILRGRFARGEIDAEEYERSLKTLRGEPGRIAYEDYVHEATRQLKGKPSARQ